MLSVRLRDPTATPNFRLGIIAHGIRSIAHRQCVYNRANWHLRLLFEVAEELLAAMLEIRGRQPPEPVETYEAAIDTFRVRVRQQVKLLHWRVQACRIPLGLRELGILRCMTPCSRLAPLVEARYFVVDAFKHIPGGGEYFLFGTL
jgi:hypothetical protein